jgi:CTP:molybdopterin cytidylyltransferase MocA
MWTPQRSLTWKSAPPDGRGVVFCLPESNGRVVIKKYPEHLRTVNVRDMYELKDVDSPEDLSELLER